jgi:hypothetical protein
VAVDGRTIEVVIPTPPPRDEAPTADPE